MFAAKNCDCAHCAAKHYPANSRTEFAAGASKIAYERAAPKSTNYASGILPVATDNVDNDMPALIADDDTVPAPIGDEYPPVTKKEDTASEKAAALKRAADELAEIYAAREAEAYLAETNKKLIDAMAKVELADAAVERANIELAEAQVAAAEVQSLREKYEEIIDKEIDTSEKRVIPLKAEIIK